LVIAIVEFFLLCSVSSCQSQGLAGCTDPLANNYDPDATINDGSCTYDPISISPQQTFSLDEQVKGTSGLILWDGYLWTHNDHADSVLYGLDTSNANIERTYALEGTLNGNWEEISQDQNYIYIGDFGNNRGNRTDLHILRIDKNTLIAGNPVIDTIWFSYADQTDFVFGEVNQTDFDCEAMIVSEDSIYLFTKEWISYGTTVYRLPKIPGKYVTTKKAAYDIQGLVTGTTYLEPERLVVLCGYTNLLQPFIFFFYDFRGHDFFHGNKRRINISLPFHQVEGVVTQDGIKYYLSNESFTMQSLINTPQMLHVLDLSLFLEEYLASLTSNRAHVQLNDGVFVYPNPAGNCIIVKIDQELIPATYKVYDQMARIMKEGILTGESSVLDVSNVKLGLFTMSIGKDCERVFRILKQ